VDVSIPLAALGLGIALGASPGPVQLLLFSEASRGGAGRGLRAMAGANATFGAMMLVLAAGCRASSPARRSCASSG
jgi:threonine/homoserine/homoserine lactone efflux protein